MIYCVIDAMENRDVTAIIITRDSLHTEMYGTVRVSIDGIMDEMLLNIDIKKYRDKVVVEWGKKVI